MSVDDTRRRFRELYRLHRRRGEVRPVEKYQRMFHGHSALVAREYENLRNEPQHVSSDDRDADLTAARQVRDKVEITLNRLGQPSSERYRLRKELGRGAMGAVYDVRDGTLGRHVAMKVINEKISAVQRSALGATTGLAPAPLLVRRFVQEARITAFLDHPGVPPVHEMGIDPEGHLFFTMKVVDGLSFQEVLEQRAEAPEEWPLPRLLQIFIRVCDTLSFAHTKGVVHRDLKPANLMIGSFGEVYVMDWGLAKVLADAPVHHPNDSAGRLLDDSYGPSNALSATMVGSALGSPPFMPPEQAFGAIGDIGPHSDIYALGAMLYQVLTDHAPYTQPGGPGGSTAIIAAVKRGPPPPVKELAPDAPHEVAAIVEKAMARMVSDRYASMDALSADLQAYLDGRVVSVYGRGRMFALRKWVVRNAALSAALGLALVTMLAGVAVIALQEQSAVEEIGHQRDRAQNLLKQQSEQRTRADGLRLCALSLAMSDADATNALLVAAEGAELAPGLDANNALYAALARHRERLYLDGHADYVVDARFGPSGKLIATLARNGRAIIWNAITGELLHRVDANAGPVLGLRFAPRSGHLLTHHKSGTLRLWDLATERTLAAVETSGLTIKTLEFRPGGDELLLHTMERGVEIRDAGTLARLREVRVGEHLTRVGYSPSGNRMYSIHGDTAIRVWDPGTDRLVRQLTCPDELRGGRLSVSFDAQSETALISGKGHALIDMHTGRTLRLFDADVNVHLAAAGKRVITLRNETRAQLAGTDIRVLQLPDLTEVNTYRHPTAHGRFKIDRGGHLLVLSSSIHSQRLHLIDLDRGAAVGSLDGHAYKIASLRFSPDESELITSSNDMTARVWHLDDTSERTVRATDPGRVSVVAVSPDREFSVIRPPTPEGAPAPSLDVLVRRTGALKFRIPQTMGTVDQVQFDPAGRYVLVRMALKTGAAFRCHALPSGELLGSIDETAAQCSISADGNALVTIGKGMQVRTYRLPGCEPVGQATPDGTARRLSVSGDGLTLVLLLEGGQQLRAWNVRDNRGYPACVGHTGTVKRVHLNADGTRIVSNAVDATVRIWDARTGHELAKARGLNMSHTNVVYSHDEQYVLTRSPRRIRLLRSNDLTAVAEIDPLAGNFRAGWFAPDMSAFFSEHAGIVRRWTLDPLGEARTRASREIDPKILRRFEIGTEQERDDRQQEMAYKTRSSTTAASWGNRCLDIERYDESVRAFLHGTELNPDCFRSWFGLARAHCHRARGRPDTPEGQTTRATDRQSALKAFAQLMRTAAFLRPQFEVDEASAEISGLPEYAALARTGR